MLIEDGSGKGGWKAGVTPESKLEVCAVISTVDLYCNQKNGVSYSIVLSETPTTSGSCFCYIKNEDIKDLVISSVKICCVSDEVCMITLGDSGIPVDGVDGIFVNRKAGCGNITNAVCKRGSNITGLSGGHVVDSLSIKSVSPSIRYGWESALVVPRNHTVSFYVETGGANVRMTVSLHFCECN